MTPLGMQADDPHAGVPPQEPSGDAALAAAGADSEPVPDPAVPEPGPTGDAALAAAGADSPAGSTPPAPKTASRPSGDAALAAAGADPLGATPRRRFGWLSIASSWWYWAAGALLWLVLGILGNGWFRYAAFALAIYDGGFAVVRYRGLSATGRRNPPPGTGGAAPS